MAHHPITLSPRDREILKEELKDQIEALRPITQMGTDWRPTFAEQVTFWRGKANGTPVNSEAHSEYLGWSLAHQFILEEDSNG